MAELAGTVPSFAYLGIATELVDAVLERAKVTLGETPIEEHAVTPAITAVRMTGAAGPRRAAAARPRSVARHLRRHALDRAPRPG